MIGKFLQLMVALLIISGAVSGCAQMKPLPPSQISLLEEYKAVRGWSAVQIENAVKEYEQRYAQTPSDMNRVRLALALGFGKSVATYPTRAIQLLDETAKNATTSPSDATLFAEVFAEILKEQFHNESKLGIAEARINTLTKQVESERTRADELERKLEAIKIIEKSLRKR